MRSLTRTRYRRGEILTETVSKLECFLSSLGTAMVVEKYENCVGIPTLVYEESLHFIFPSDNRSFDRLLGNAIGFTCDARESLLVMEKP